MRWAPFCSPGRDYFCHVCKIPKPFLQSLQCYWLRRPKDGITDWFGIFPMLCLAERKKEKKTDLQFKTARTESGCQSNLACTTNVTNTVYFCLIASLNEWAERKTKTLLVLFCLLLIFQFHGAMQIKRFVCMNAETCTAGQLQPLCLWWKDRK